jgi:hypothetical protein
VTDTLVIDIVLISILVVVCIAVGVLAWQALRRRRDQLRSEINASHASVEERAFNRIQIGRSAADHLERSGADVSGSRRLLDQASKSYDAGHHDDALALASSAHATLLAQTKSPAPLAPATLSVPAPDTASPADSSPGAPITPTMSPPPTSEPSNEGTATPPGRLPKNKAESHFQLRLLDEEIAAGGPAGTTASTVTGVQAFAREAHASYDRGDFTDALRVALKGRRTLGARLETLPPSSVLPATAADAPTATAPGGSDRCRKCGQPLRPGDMFCRGCGAAVAATNCARCGDSLEGSDQFCGRCGAPRPQ